MGDEQSDSTLSQRLQEALERNRHLEDRLEDFERVMEALREGEQRWRWLAERMDEAFWLVSPDESEVHYVSPAYESIIGRSCESFRADPDSWIESLHPQDKEAITAGIEKRGPGLHQDERSKEVRVLNADGSIRWLWVRSMPVFESDGTLVARAGVALDITERKNSEEELRQAALHDKLTHLPNRSLFNRRLSRAIDRSKNEPDYQFSVLFLDFDRFKIINDSLGHEVGDLLLVNIAERLKSILSSDDTTCFSGDGHIPARLGGDEFVILLDEIKGHDDAIILAERLQEALSAPHHLGDHDVISTASIGIVTSWGQYDRAEDVLRDADTAMYHAKSRGRARHVVFDDRMHEEAVQRLQLEEDLRHAVDNDEFWLAYQPIIALSTGDLIGFEALLRWKHPQRGEIPPGDFIALAEELGLIVPIGRWVLQEATAQLKTWQERFPQDPPLTMNVNLSKRQISQRDLFDTVARVISETGVDPATLKLEVTESVIIESTEYITPLLKRLKGLGIGMCMDDFGTGHSSLNCLHKFPIEVLKIDRSFVVNSDENREYAAVIHAIITLAHTLNMTVVGEGVEHGGQLAQLQALECDWAQGNLFSMPMKVQAAEVYMSDQRGLAKSA